jgi:hypothetical protein
LVANARGGDSRHGIRQCLKRGAVTWLSFALLAAFGLLLTLFSGAITFMLVPAEARRELAGLSELLVFAVALMGLYLLSMSSASFMTLLANGAVFMWISNEIHPTHVTPTSYPTAIKSCSGVGVAKNAERIASGVGSLGLDIRADPEAYPCRVHQPWEPTPAEQESAPRLRRQ